MRGVALAPRMRPLPEYLRGGRPSFGRSQYSRPLPELEAWRQRRRRRGCGQHWRAVRTKVRELLKLGTVKNTALLTALSRKGPWHRSRTLATQTGMTNQWLSETLGLVSIRALGISLHSPT
jgi:RNA-directed DNA polymerase